MSTPFYDLASLVLVPSGYKSQKVYAQKPLTTDGQLTFSRASTATRVNSAGLIETVSSNVPRLDYLGSTCPKLNLEPQRTNRALYSQDFANGWWEIGSAASVTVNTAISPDGTQNADTLTANGSGPIYVRRNIFGGTAQTCSVSIFAKKANNRYVGLRNSGTTSQHDVFDFDTKTWTNNTGATLSYDELGNGWFRLKSTNTDAVNLNYYWSVLPAVNTSGNENTTASNLSVYIWGAQAEQNANYVTSYIPTTTAEVTRLGDALYDESASSLIGQTEGTLFVQFKALTQNNSGASRISISSGTTANWIFVGTESNNIRGYVRGSNSVILSDTSVAITGNDKVAIAYKTGSLALYINGVQIATSSSTLTFNAALDDISTSVAGSYTIDDTLSVNQLMVFKTRLPNAQLAELTSL